MRPLALYPSLPTVGPPLCPPFSCPLFAKIAAVNLLDITVLNPDGAPFTSGFSFQVTFECVAPLAGELEWRVVYVGSARSEAHDQELDSVLVGPVMLGVSRFVLDVPAPNPAKIPAEDLLGATAIMITCSYKGKEFVKVGYWVSNSPKNPPAEGASFARRPRAAAEAGLLTLTPLPLRWQARSRQRPARPRTLCGACSPPRRA